MKNLTKTIVILLMLCIGYWLLPIKSGNAFSSSTIQQDTEPPKVICLPGIYPQKPGNCLVSGPAGYFTRLADLGITIPATPFTARQADPTLSQIDVRYGEVTTPNAPVYGSLDDAINGKKQLAIQKINASFAYISYTDAVETDGKRLYNIAPGAWMKAANISRVGVIPLFQGLTFEHTPLSEFGWILPYLGPGPLETKRTPGYTDENYTGRLLNDKEVVQVFSVESIDDSEWYLIGPDEWIPGKVVARVIPNTIPPEGVTGGRWIEINLYEQTLTVYDNNELVFATVIASGSDPFWTQPGLFQIYEKHEKTPMRGSFEADASDAYYLEDVPWTLYYDQARAIHGAYWRAKMGFPQSHGCVNMTVGDAHWIYNWANIGDWVYVWDPSGRTPTDPGIYSSGGY